MNTKQIKKELEALNRIIEGWNSNDVAYIEQDIALDKLKSIYEQIKFPTAITEPQLETTPTAAPTVPSTEEDAINEDSIEKDVAEQEIEVEFIFEDEEEEEELLEIEDEPVQEEREEEVKMEVEEEESTMAETIAATTPIIASAIASEAEAATFPAESTEDFFAEDSVTIAATPAAEQEIIINTTNEFEAIEPQPTASFEENKAPVAEVATFSASKEKVSEETPTINNLFGEEEPLHKPSRTKHQRMMSVYDDIDDEAPAAEESVDISQIFEIDALDQGIETEPLENEEDITIEYYTDEDSSTTETVENVEEEEEEFIIHSPEPKAEAPQVLADVIAPTTPTIADTIESTPSLADEIVQTPIKSLRDGIGINDKFLMIRDLFNGDAEQYEHIITTLDSMDSFNDCMIYIVENFSWNPESDGAKFIMKLLERKLA